jgi:hypothetical protein|tara:strand:- start:20 stop:379 length:360 start_codon:yes stop_codon:yes gene_type:complete
MLKLTDILNEEVETHAQGRVDAGIGLLAKAMKHLNHALRDIEASIPFIDDEEKRDKVLKFKESLIDEFGTQFSKFDSDYDGGDKLINRIGKFIDDNSENAWNFNINGDPNDRAPEGNLE